MKYLGTVTHEKDLTTKEYVDGLVIKSVHSTLEVEESGLTSIEAPIDLSTLKSLNVYHNGILLLKDIHYTFSENNLSLLNFTTYKGDIFTFIGSNMDVTIL